MMYTIDNLTYYNTMHYNEDRIGRKASVFNNWVFGHMIIVHYMTNTRHRQICKALKNGHVKGVNIA